MPELRQDVTTRDWVVLAPERAARPHETRGAGLPASEGAPPDCPFCPGNESLTPPELDRIPAAEPTAQHWSARVVSNRHPAFRPDPPAEPEEQDRWFRRRPAVGAHEVVIETPRHAAHPAEASESELTALLQLYQRRYHVLRASRGVEVVVPFKNHGAAAGASIEHSHSQIIAGPVESPLMRRRYEVAREHYRDRGRCLYCDLRDAERAAGDRILFDTERFTAFLPFASRWPGEVWILPRAHRSSFGDASDEELAAAARALRRALRMLRTAMEDPPFNYVLHSAPLREERQPFFVWHIQLVPRRTTPAGFELGSGMMINTVRPEDAAQALRRHGG